MNVVLYFMNDCCRCKELEAKLNEKNIEHDRVEITMDNVGILFDKGFDSAPVLSINDEMIGFEDALKWAQDLNT